jgi:histidyl-tRNA synthetase
MLQMNTQPARGMRDFLPADVRRREYVIGVIREVYERYGFEPLETPAVENIETLTGKYGEEGNQLIFKILKRGEHEKTGEADLALRYDLTVPLARVVAEYGDKLPKFFKRYQIQPVWRADRPARGRFREFYQCDVDAIGSRSPIVEAELCAAVSDVLLKLGFNNFTIRLNHRGVLKGVLDAAGVPNEKHADALTALDKIDKIGREGVAKEFAERGIVNEAGNKLLALFNSFSNLSEDARKTFINIAEEKKQKEAFLQQLKGVLRFGKQSALEQAEGTVEREAMKEAFDKAERQTNLERNLTIAEILYPFIREDEVAAKCFDELVSILLYVQGTVAANYINIDPSLARGLSYYTGAIMEISVPDLAGSLGGGGRYDNLVGMFSKQSIPACGFSLGLERIIVVMTERGMFPPDLIETAAADVLVTVWDEESAADSLALARELRAASLRVDVYPGADKIGKQLKYAASVGVPFVVVAGTDERAQGEVALKDMKSGEQQQIARGELASRVRERIAGKRH